VLLIFELLPSWPESFRPLAIPNLFVVWLAAVMEPPPKPTANVTATPLTGFAPAAVTFTDGALATVAPGTADWLSPPLTAMLVAPPDGSTFPLSDLEAASRSGPEPISQPNFGRCRHCLLLPDDSHRRTLVDGRAVAELAVFV
jgi:hypothetical protein